jgi:hypothetical protein
MAYALLAASPRHSPHDQLTTSRKSRFKVPSRPRIVPTLDAEPSLQDLRCAVGASEFSIAPADRAAHSPRFPSLAAFERRPGGRCPCGDLCDRGRHPKPVTFTALTTTSATRQLTLRFRKELLPCQRLPGRAKTGPEHMDKKGWRKLAFFDPRASSDDSTWRPSALAVLRLVTSSLRVGA